MSQETMRDIESLFKDSLGKLAVIHWHTRTHVAMVTQMYVSWIEPFQHDGETWVRVRDDHDMSRVCAPLTDITMVRVLR